MKRQFFLDTNVLLDALAERPPFATAALKLLDVAERGEIRIYVSAISFNNLYYIMRKSVSHHKALALIAELLEIVQVLPLDHKTLHKALSSGGSDYEDAIQMCSADLQGAIEAIVTRNAKDFRQALQPVLDPLSALALLAND